MANSTIIHTLLTALRDLPPWHRKDFSAVGWRRYLRAARLLQDCKPTDVERALLEFLDEADDFAGVENETRLFLLMRVVFELPEHATAKERRIFKGWLNWPVPNSSGTVNLSWPVGYEEGQPVLLAPFEGAEGPRYGALEEYRYLLDHYPFRRVEPGREGS